ncbi:MAG: hypothetical protein A2901_05970 [Elusimicrobia bacterium RIFCSPLOWO2_01_FULL_54_10]|nr:MAG: hypothetical protein A2901_05970 [Elusimicrobia bacterium RIFCSPLOWO2_01_FULL_54_10]
MDVYIPWYGYPLFILLKTIPYIFIILAIYLNIKPINAPYNKIIVFIVGILFLKVFVVGFSMIRAGYLSGPTYFTIQGTIFRFLNYLYCILVLVSAITLLRRLQRTLPLFILTFIVSLTLMFRLFWAWGPDAWGGVPISIFHIIFFGLIIRYQWILTKSR